MSDPPDKPQWWQSADGRWHPPERARPFGTPVGPPPTGPRLDAGPPPVWSPGEAGVPPFGSPVYSPIEGRNEGMPRMAVFAIIGVFVAIPVLAVLAIVAMTFLGRSTTSHFSAIGPAVDSGSGSASDFGDPVSSTTTLPVASVAGQPCVPLTDPLPTGSPDVPVPVGPPPADLVIENLVEGTGPVITPGATVTVDYIGVACSSGHIIDSSYSRGEPATFALSQVIEGWSNGLVGARVGGRRLLGIPPELAYGPDGHPPDIAGDESLWFVVDVRSIEAT